MTIEKLHNGAWKCSSMKGGYFVHMLYFGYTKKQAISMFKSFLKGE